MLILTRLLALAVPLDNTGITDTRPSRLFGLELRDLFLILGVAVVLGLILFLWVYLTHKSRRSHHSGSSLSKPLHRAERKPVDRNSSPPTKMRRKRRRHPDNLPRNPTLGETGGLPPIRPEEPPTEVAQQ